MIAEAASLASEIIFLSVSAEKMGRVLGLTSEILLGGETVHDALDVLPPDSGFRDTAKAGNKLVAFGTRGGATEIDRILAEALVPPLLHIVKNAVAHAIEAPEARREAGKDEYGQVLITAERDGAAGTIDNEVIQVLDFERIVMDVMPQMDGYTLTNTIKNDAALSVLPVVLHSSLTNDTIIRRAAKVHADGVVAKENPEALPEALEKYL